MRESYDIKPGKCRFCGRDAHGARFDQWVKDTFTDWDKLKPGDIVCDDCMFFLDEHSDALASKVGKDKPQRMRNYSHIFKRGEWFPLSKANKAMMLDLLLSPPFPELAIIAESGQKHIAYRARRNSPNSNAGWVQFEELPIWVEPATLRELTSVMRRMLGAFSKSSLASGDYPARLIKRYGIEAWRSDETALAAFRGKPIFTLALFLSTTEEGETEHD